MDQRLDLVKVFYISRDFVLAISSLDIVQCMMKSLMFLIRIFSEPWMGPSVNDQI